MTTSLDTIRLDALENIIALHLHGFMATGDALMEIRDTKLYKARGFKTFDSYCKEKWGWDRNRGYQLITAAKAVKSFPPEMLTILSNEGQARALAKVQEDERVEVLQSAVDSGLTAASIQEAAESWTPGLAEQAMIDRIGKLFGRLSKVEGSPEFAMVKSANIVREIGLHLVGLAGSGINAKKIVAFKAKLPKALNLMKCRLCAKVSKSLKEKAIKPEDMMPVSEDVMRIRGVSPEVKYRKPQHASSLAPCTAVFSALNNARAAVDKQMTHLKEWDDIDRDAVQKEIERHATWLQKTIAQFND